MARFFKHFLFLFFFNVFTSHIKYQRLRRFMFKTAHTGTLKTRNNNIIVPTTYLRNIVDLLLSGRRGNSKFLFLFFTFFDIT